MRNNMTRRTTKETRNGEKMCGLETGETIYYLQNEKKTGETV